MFKESGVKMDYKMIKEDGYNLHLVKTDKFKEIEVHLYLSNVLDKDTYYKRNIVIDLLTENNSEFPNRRDKSLFLEDLYGARLFSAVCRDGRYHTCEMIMSFLDSSNLEDNIMEPSIKFMFNSLFNPYLKDNQFDNDIFEQRKEYFIQSLKTDNDYPKLIAKRNCRQLIDPDTPIGLADYGTIEDLEKLTNEEVVEEYNKMINNDIVDIVVCGNIDEKEITTLIKKYAKFSKRNNEHEELFINPRLKDKVTLEKVTKDINQSLLIQEYNVVDLTPYEYKYVMHIFNEILGGGSLETKLYRRVRNEHSLCYSISSYYHKYDNYLEITTGVDAKNIKETQDIIAKTIEEMKDSITDEELTNAINSIINSIILEFNSISYMQSFWYYSYLGDLDPIDQRLDNYRHVTKEDIYKLFDKIKLNTVYILEGSDSHE